MIAVVPPLIIGGWAWHTSCQDVKQRRKRRLHLTIMGAVPWQHLAHLLASILRGVIALRPAIHIPSLVRQPGEACQDRQKVLACVLLAQAQGMQRAPLMRVEKAALVRCGSWLRMGACQTMARPPMRRKHMHRAEGIASQYGDGHTCFHSLACMVHGRQRHRHHWRGALEAAS